MPSDTVIPTEISTHEHHVDSCPHEPSRDTSGPEWLELLNKDFTVEETRHLNYVRWLDWLTESVEQDCFYAFKLKSHIAKAAAHRWGGSNEEPE